MKRNVCSTCLLFVMIIYCFLFQLCRCQSDASNETTNSMMDASGDGSGDGPTPEFISSSLTDGQIAGIVVGSCAGAVLIGGGSFYGYKYATNKNRVKQINTSQDARENGGTQESYHTNAAFTNETAA